MRLFRRVAGLICIWMLLMPPMATVRSETAGESSGESGVSAAQPATYGATLRYDQFLTDNRQTALPDGQVGLAAAESVLVDGQMLETLAGKENVAVIQHAGSIEWTAEIGQTGLYEMTLSYNSALSLYNDYQFALWIDDTIQYDIASRIILKKCWEDTGLDADGGFRVKNGNEIKPGQKELQRWQETALSDLDGYNDEPLKFSLTAGTHTIRLVFERGGIAVEKLTIGNTPGMETKQDVLAGWAEKGYTKIDKEENTGIVIQAEHPVFKSDSSIMPNTDRSSAATQPNDPYHIRLNTIGGKNYSKNGQWITWGMTVPQAGLYRIDMRVRQDLVRGIRSARRIFIDGKVPYREMDEVTFPFSDRWYIKTIGDDDPDLIYLSAGEHTLSMQVVSPYADIVNQINSLIIGSNELYRKIIMITGHSPDPYNDYKIDLAVPDLLSALHGFSDQLTEIHDGMIRSGFLKGGEIVLIEQFLSTVRSFIEKPETIPQRLDTYKNGISSCAALIDILTSQPLEIDYIKLTAYNAEQDRSELPFFRSFAFTFQQYLSTYLEDYGTFTEESDKKALKVWVSSGRDQTQIIKNLVEEEFTADTDIPVSVNLVQQALIQATLTGRGPDIAVFVSSVDTINLAVRNALADLSAKPDFAETVSQYHAASTGLYEYNGGCYALPLVESFGMLFYRKDILDELGIGIPKTWADFNKALITLQRKNLTVGIPSLIDSAGGGSGLNWQNAASGQNVFFETLLFQNGGSLYKDNWYESGLGSVEALDAFKQMNDYYIKYSLPTEYNFYSRFRSGEMPLAIQNYQMYNQLKVAAPEIRGLWGMSEIPGVLKEDGSIDNTVSGVGTSIIMFRKTDNQEDGWKFMKWFTSADVQSRYGRQIEMVLGTGARYEPANVEAFKTLPWTQEEKTNLLAQWDKMEMMQMSPVSYYINRNITNAFRKVVYQRQNSRETLNYYNKEIMREMSRKKKQFIQ